MASPPAITIDMIKVNSEGDFRDWIEDRKNRRVIPHRLEGAGYLPVRNPDAEDGYYRVGQRRQAIYAKADLSPAERFRAAAELSREARFGGSA